MSSSVEGERTEGKDEYSRSLTRWHSGQEDILAYYLSSHCITGKQRLQINNKEIMHTWESFGMHYKGDIVNFSCRQTCSNVPLLAVAFKRGIEWMENIKFWCHVTKDCSDTHFNSFSLKHFRCWDERQREKGICCHGRLGKFW